MALFDGLRHGQYMGVPSAGVPKLTNMADYIQFIPKSPQAIEGAGEVEKATHQHRTGMATLNQQIAQVQAQKNAVKANRTLDNYEQNVSEYSQLTGLESQLKLNQMSYLNAAETVKGQVDEYAKEVFGSGKNDKFLINEQGNAMVDITKTGLHNEFMTYALQGKQSPLMDANEAEEKIVGFYMQQKDNKGNLLMTEEEAREMASMVISGSFVNYGQNLQVLDNYTGEDALRLPYISEEHFMGFPTGEKPYTDAISEIKTNAGHLLTQTTRERPGTVSDPYGVMGAVFTDEWSSSYSEGVKRNAMHLNASIKAIISNTSPDVERSLKEEYYSRLSSSRLDKTSFFFNPLNETVKKDSKGNESLSLGFSSDETDPSNYFNFHAKFVTDQDGNYIAEEKDKEGNITEVLYDPEKHKIKDIKTKTKTWEEKQQGFQEWKEMKVIQDVMPSLELETKVVDTSKRKRSAVSRGNEPEGLPLNAVQSALARVEPPDIVPFKVHGSSNGQSVDVNWTNAAVWSGHAYGKELNWNLERTVTGTTVEHTYIDGERKGAVFMRLGHGYSFVDANVLNTEDGFGGTVLIADDIVVSQLPVVTNKKLREAVNDKFSGIAFAGGEDLLTEISKLSDGLGIVIDHTRNSIEKRDIQGVKNFLDAMLSIDINNPNQDAFDAYMNYIKVNKDKLSLSPNLIGNDGSINRQFLEDLNINSLLPELADEIQLFYAVADMSEQLLANHPEAMHNGRIKGFGDYEGEEFDYYYKGNNAFFNLFEEKTGTDSDDKTKFDLQSLYAKSEIDQRQGYTDSNGRDISTPTGYKKIYVLYSDQNLNEIAQKSVFVNRGGNATVSIHDTRNALQTTTRGSKGSFEEISPVRITNLNELSLSEEEFRSLKIPAKAKHRNFDEDRKLASGYSIIEMLVPIVMNSNTMTSRDKSRDLNNSPN